MKVTSFLFTLLGLFFGAMLFGQANPTPETESSQTLSKSLGLYVFPGNNQDQVTQQNDEAACFNWAKQQTGVDPLNLPQVQTQQAPQNAAAAGAVVGAAKGAAAGAMIGAIAGDAGKGAAIGATAGGVGGLGAGRRSKAYAEQQAEVQAQQQQTAAMTEFNKAFKVCMEAKGYTIQ